MHKMLNAEEKDIKPSTAPQPSVTRGVCLSVSVSVSLSVCVHAHLVFILHYEGCFVPSLMYANNYICICT